MPTSRIEACSDGVPAIVITVMVLGIDLLAAAVAHYVLQQTILRGQPAEAPLARARGRDLKGTVSQACSVAGIAAAAVRRTRLDGWIWVAQAFFVGVAVMWLVPDRRIERALVEEPQARA